MFRRILWKYKSCAKGSTKCYEEKKKKYKKKLIDQNKFAIFCFEANLTFKK